MQADHGGPRKKLWVRDAGIPDNQTTPGFLEDMVVNAHVHQRRYHTVALAATAISQQLCVVVLAALVPVALLRHKTSPAALLGVDVALLLLGLVVASVHSRRVPGGTWVRGTRQVGLLAGGVYCLAPLLRGLGGTISHDSVVALSTALLVVHLYLHDYRVLSSSAVRLTSAVSLAAAISAAVLLASLLRTDMEVFAHILFSLEAFLASSLTGWPAKRTPAAAKLALTATLLAAAAWGLVVVAHAGWSVALLVAVAFINLLSPAVLVRVHKFKAKISGAWDEQAPQIPLRFMPAAAQGH